MELEKCRNQLRGSRQREEHLRRRNQELYEQLEYLKGNNNHPQQQRRVPTPPWASCPTNDFHLNLQNYHCQRQQQELESQQRKPANYNNNGDGRAGSEYWSRGETEARFKTTTANPVLIPRDRKSLRHLHQNQDRPYPVAAEYRPVNQQFVTFPFDQPQPLKKKCIERPPGPNLLGKKSTWVHGKDGGSRNPPQYPISPIPVDLSKVKQEVMGDDEPYFYNYGGFGSNGNKDGREECGNTLRNMTQEYMDESKVTSSFGTINAGFVDLAIVKQELVDDDYNRNSGTNNDENGHGMLFGTAPHQPSTLLPIAHYNHPPEIILSGNFGVNSIYPIEDGIISFLRHSGSTILSSTQQQTLQRKWNCFIKSAKSSSAFNPFPNHHLVIFVDAAGNSNSPQEHYYADFFQVVTKLIERFGKYVLYFTFYSKMNICPLHWYQQINKYLRMMPNLQMIQIRMPPSGQDEDDDMFWSNELKILRTVCEPFPVIKQLVTVDFENVPYQIMNNAFRQNAETIAKIQVTRTIAAMGNWRHSEYFGLKNVTEFSITCFEMKEVRQLGHVNWPLRNLTIRLEIELKMFTDLDKENELFEVFTILQHFAETLTSLKITFYQQLDWDGRLRLPKLQNLEVYFVEDASLNFILGLRSLEVLKVHLYTEQLGSSQDIVKFHQHVTDMKESNIWNLVPTLKRIEMTTYYDNKTFSCVKPKPNLASLFSVYR